MTLPGYVGQTRLKNYTYYLEIEVSYAERVLYNVGKPWSVVIRKYEELLKINVVVTICMEGRASCHNNQNSTAHCTKNAC